MTSPALQYSYNRFIAGDPKRERSYEQALFDVEVARMAYDLRAKARLGQRALAKRVGTSASVIGRIEDADYEGDSLAMVRRIAAALGKRLEIRLTAVTKPKKSKARRMA
jgi:transcriptional regulator with XRE-family HTH domain